MLYILRPSHFQEDIKALRKSLSPRRKQEKGHKTNSATGRVRQREECSHKGQGRKPAGTPPRGRFQYCKSHLGKQAEGLSPAVPRGDKETYTVQAQGDTRKDKTGGSKGKGARKGSQSLEHLSGSWRQGGGRGVRKFPEGA